MAAAIGMGGHFTGREIPMERGDYGKPRIKSFPSPHRKSKRQKYRAPAYVGERDPRHIHPRHLRATK